MSRIRGRLANELDCKSSAEGSTPSQCKGWGRSQTLRVDTCADYTNYDKGERRFQTLRVDTCTDYTDYDLVS